MKLFWALVGFIGTLISFLPMARSADPASKASDLVRVHLATISQEKIILSGEGLQFQAANRTFQVVALPHKVQAEIQILSHKGQPIWRVKQGSGPERLYAQPYLLVQGHHLRWGSKALPTKILLQRSADKVDLIGMLPLEEYLIGVVSSEMPLSWPMESLKAQAVAARSYALAVIRERKNEAWHLQSNVLDQVFRHVLEHDEKSPLIRRAAQAVRDTEGVRLLALPQGPVLKAFYHADCGGRTTLAKNVWAGGGDSGTAVDSSCPASPKAQWTLRLSQQQLIKKLGTRFNALQLIRPSQADRISKVRLRLPNGKTQLLAANDFRQRLGFQDLKSTEFDLAKEGEDYVFKGRGFGHGVGLCQWGSRGLGRQGWTYENILRHYYPLAHLQK